jgi:hypothetical protein
MSRRTEEILERYRASQSLDEASRARLLGAIQERLASGAGIPKAGEAHAHAHATGTSLAKTLSIVPKVVLGFALVGAPAAWLARGSLTRGAPQAAAPSGVQASTPAEARASSSQGARQDPAPTSASAWMPSIPAVAPANSAQGALPDPAPSAGAPSADALVSRRPLQAARRGREIEAHTWSADQALTAIPTDHAFDTPSAPLPSSAPADGSTPTPAPSPTPTPTASHASPEVDEEVRLVGLAYSLLRDGAPARALAVLEEHERRFPDGKLAELRKVTRVLALCQSGRVADARTERDRFLSLYPRSPYSNRVRSACGDPSSP